MFIRAVDAGFEQLLRARLPLPEAVGDISFEPPTSAWSAQLSRLTVNLYLYDIDRSGQPGRGLTQRVDANGRLEQRAPQPMIKLAYLVSAWAGNPRDEHQLIGDVVSLLAGLTTLPAEYLNPAPHSSVVLQFGAGDGPRLRDIWSGIGANLKASFVLHASVAADTHDWAAAAPPVQRVEVLASPTPR